MRSELRSRPLVAGMAEGPALVLEDRLSFAMGFDPMTGRIKDPHGGSAGIPVTDRIVVMASGRGSSSASTALAEAVRLRTAPAALVLGELDEILAVGAIVARRLYGRTCPIVVVPHERLPDIRDGVRLVLDRDGMLAIHD